MQQEIFDMDGSLPLCDTVNSNDIRLEIFKTQQAYITLKMIKWCKYSN